MVRTGSTWATEHAAAVHLANDGSCSPPRDCIRRGDDDRSRCRAVPGGARRIGDQYGRCRDAPRFNSGIAVAVYHANESVLVRAWGYADVDAGRRLRPSDPIEVASVTKQLVAVGIMRLVDEKRIALEDTVARMIPPLARRYPTVTVRQLLSHTSGLGYVDDELIGNPPGNMPESSR